VALPEAERTVTSRADQLPQPANVLAEARLKSGFVVTVRLKRLREVYAILGWLNCFATLQATCFVARRDESAKRAHSLRGEVAIVRFHPKQFSQRSSNESTQVTNTDDELVQRSIHSQFRFFP
jgi:hypothetical protein